MPITVQVISPDKTVFEGDVEMVSAPGTEGDLAFKEGHAPILSDLKIGTVRVFSDSALEKVQEIAISGGFVEIIEGKVLILCESGEKKEEIDVERAQQAKQRAEKHLSRKGEDIDIPRAQAALARALNRIHIAGKSGR